MTKPSRLLALATAALLLFAMPALGADAPAEAGETTLFDSPGVEQIVTSVITLLIFLGLMAILAKFAWGPIVKSLEDREGRIRSDIEAAERARADSEKARAEHQRQLDEADTRVRDLIAQANADGQQLATRIRMQAQEEAEEIKERAQRDIEQSRREAIESVRSEAATLAVSIAEKILGREVTVDDQQRLIEASLDEMQKSGIDSKAEPKAVMV